VNSESACPVTDNGTCSGVPGPTGWGTFKMNDSKNRLGLLRVPRVRVSAHGVGVVSHAGVGCCGRSLPGPGVRRVRRGVGRYLQGSVVARSGGGVHRSGGSGRGGRRLRVRDRAVGRSAVPARACGVGEHGVATDHSPRRRRTSGRDQAGPGRGQGRRHGRRAPRQRPGRR